MIDFGVRCMAFNDEEMDDFLLDSEHVDVESELGEYGIDEEDADSVKIVVTRTVVNYVDVVSVVAPEVAVESGKIRVAASRQKTVPTVVVASARVRDGKPRKSVEKAAKKKAANQPVTKSPAKKAPAKTVAAKKVASKPSSFRPAATAVSKNQAKRAAKPAGKRTAPNQTERKLQNCFV